MKFTYEVDLLCESRFIHHSSCAGYMAGDIGEDVKLGQSSALANATAQGWLQIGNAVW